MSDPIYYVAPTDQTTDVMVESHAAHGITESTPPLWSVEEAAELLRCSPRLIRSLCASGKLPATKVGKSWRINRDALLSFAGLA